MAWRRPLHRPLLPALMRRAAQAAAKLKALGDAQRHPSQVCFVSRWRLQPNDAALCIMSISPTSTASLPHGSRPGCQQPPTHVHKPRSRQLVLDHRLVGLHPRQALAGARPAGTHSQLSSSSSAPQHGHLASQHRQHLPALLLVQRHNAQGHPVLGHRHWELVESLIGVVQLPLRAPGQHRQHHLRAAAQRQQRSAWGRAAKSATHPRGRCSGAGCGSFWCQPALQPLPHQQQPTLISASASG